VTLLPQTSPGSLRWWTRSPRSRVPSEPEPPFSGLP